MAKILPAMWETWVRSLGREDPLKEGMATHFSILAWRIVMDRGAWQTSLWGRKELDTTERLSTTTQPHPSRRCGFDPWVRKIPWRKTWQLIPVFLPGESHGLRSLVATAHRVTKSQRRLSRHTQPYYKFTFMQHFVVCKLPSCT